jgi:nitroreductase/NAD-dependent dihydropyrimidine dehydrogenase PreA subunit
MKLIEVNQEQCILCGLCTQACPVGTFAMSDNGPVEIRPEACIACGHCVAVCPHMAIDNSKTPLAKQTALKEFPVLTPAAAEEFLRSRRSIRYYKKNSVPQEQLLQLIEIARFAPTGSNRQGVSYVVVQDKEVLQKATQITIEWMEAQLSLRTPVHASFPFHVHAYRAERRDTILRNAPHLILATTQKTLPHGRENSIFSFAYLELFATSLGLGSCWAGLLEMCVFSKHSPLLELFKIPEDKHITGAVMVGYPQYSYKRLVDRNPLDVTWL